MMSGEVLAAGEGWYISVTDDHRLQLTIRGGDARMIAERGGTVLHVTLPADFVKETSRARRRLRALPEQSDG